MHVWCRVGDGSRPAIGVPRRIALERADQEAHRNPTMPTSAHRGPPNPIEGHPQKVALYGRRWASMNEVYTAGPSVPWRTGSVARSSSKR